MPKSIFPVTYRSIVPYQCLDDAMKRLYNRPVLGISDKLDTLVSWDLTMQLKKLGRSSREV